MPDDDPRSDQDLVEAVNAGDDAAFETLYYRYRDWVYRLAHRFTGDEHAALDVLQDTFAYLVRKFPGFRLTAQMTTLLFRVARNAATSQHRRAHTSESLTTTNDPADASDPALRTDAESDLASVLRVLPDGQRDVLLLRFVDDLSLGQIAEALDIPVGTVKSRLHHALATLRTDERARRYFNA